jgi:dephospho-CoA kinase
MKIIGLSGGIGSGKSTVARLLHQLGIPVIDADEISHRLIEQNKKIRAILLDRFGDGIIDSHGQIDRATLAEIVFSQQCDLNFLNHLLHPAIRREVEREIARYRAGAFQLVVIDAPLLFESGWTDIVDFVWITIAPMGVILKRLEARGLNREKALLRMKYQWSDENRIRLADTVIDTNTDLTSLKITILKILDHLCLQRY